MFTEWTRHAPAGFMERIDSIVGPTTTQMSSPTLETTDETTFDHGQTVG